MGGDRTGASAFVGRHIVFPDGIMVGDVVQITETNDSKLLLRKVEPWETVTHEPWTFVVEADVSPNRLRIRRVRV